MTKILFLGGPSGSGKSSFASKYLTSLGWIHLEIDQHPKDGIAEQKLRAEWDSFYADHNPTSLHEELLRRADRAPGIVLSFPGNLVFLLSTYMPLPTISTSHICTGIPLIACDPFSSASSRADDDCHPRTGIITMEMFLAASLVRYNIHFSSTYLTLMAAAASHRRFMRTFFREAVKGSNRSMQLTATGARSRFHMTKPVPPHLTPSFSSRS